MNKFRKQSPKRTCTKVYSNYRSFKPFLVEDFNNRCGYTDCTDVWFGGSNTFHIDHFKPKKKHPHLETTYSNLVYSCSFVNISKSDKEGDFLDPCNVDYNKHFERDTDGSIIPLTNEAQFMFKEMNFGLRRYKIIWMLEQIYLKMKKMKELIERTSDRKQTSELKIILAELSIEFINYQEYLRVDL